ncbi:MAG: hypothetical protein AB8B66_02230 [Rickettsiaceae bacterium]
MSEKDLIKKMNTKGLIKKWDEVLLQFPFDWNMPRDVHKELEQIQRETKESSYLVCKNYLKNLKKKKKKLNMDKKLMTETDLRNRWMSAILNSRK